MFTVSGIAQEVISSGGELSVLRDSVPASLKRFQVPGAPSRAHSDGRSPERREVCTEV